MRRMLVAATVAALSFASFAGCGEDAPPAPQKTTAVACTTDTATVVWGPGTYGSPVVIGSWVESYSKTDRAWMSGLAASVVVDATWTDDGLSTIAPTSAARRSWQAALIHRANRTGQADGRFGPTSDSDLPMDSPAHPSKPDSHRYVTTASVRQFTMPFTIRCDRGGRLVTGTVTAPVFDGISAAVYRCGVPATSEESRIALGFCTGV